MLQFYTTGNINLLCHSTSTTKEIQCLANWTMHMNCCNSEMHNHLGQVWGPKTVQWVPVTTAWRVLRLRIEERPPIWRVAANNKLNKQSWTADKGWSSSLGVGRGANNPFL